MNTVQLQVTGMSCGHCVAAVTRALKTVPGTQEIQVDLATGRATVQGSATPESLVKAVADEGYGATLKG
ncbi:CopZ family metallochaperone [Thiomonas intermedia]|uniref:CopZ family metallochaperone n=1 Tax=Thiomonas intermedia TaxID=926 RepID=UPI0009A4B42A|nr:heavy metal-associated domain-containing protein [Thiomonas intermedia]